MKFFLRKVLSISKICKWDFWCRLHGLMCTAFQTYLHGFLQIFTLPKYVNPFRKSDTPLTVIISLGKIEKSLSFQMKPKWCKSDKNWLSLSNLKDNNLAKTLFWENGRQTYKFHYNQSLNQFLKNWLKIEILPLRPPIFSQAFYSHVRVFYDYFCKMSKFFHFHLQKA